MLKRKIRKRLRQKKAALQFDGIIMLSIVLIGQNEAEHIPRLAASIEALKQACDFPIETLFIDSASSDQSGEIAGRYFDRVIDLMPNQRLCASAGRYVGTIEARYPWVFYIDGDMELCEQFFPVIAGIEGIDDDVVGFLGLYIHRFDNNTSAFQGFAGGVVKSEWASQFGGAVILRRSAVLIAGNWNPGVYGKEEIELYARLGKGKRVVRFINLPMIKHYSEHLTRTELLLRLLYPSGGMGKVFYGYGQGVRSLLISGNLTSLIKLEFEPYLFWALLICGVMISAFLPFEWGFLLLAAELLWLSVWMRPDSIIRYLTLPLSLVAGWFRYIPYFRPSIKMWSSSDDQSS
jgi:glycosyltransferase involved in cell wall biosynthesis